MAFYKKIGRFGLVAWGKLVFPSLLVLAAVELLLRLANVAPSGFCEFMLPTDGGGLYPQNRTITNDWAPFPYITHTDALGLRQVSGSATLSGARARIITIGDSVTEGYFVDDDATYPHFLQMFLEQSSSGLYQVLNAARGGGSIDKELAILNEVVLSLRPEVLILTFVTNDISDLRGKTREQLLAHRIQFHRGNVPLRRRFAFWLLSKTALGEATYRFYWHLKYKRKYAAVGSGDERYRIRGNEEFASNAEVFARSFKGSDGMVLSAEFSREARQLSENYLFVFDRFVEVCRRDDIEPVLVFFPAYSQVYNPSTPMTIRDILRDRCRQLSVPFLDLTGPFRDRGMDQPIHLAPLDFHLNPRGNEIMARTIGEFLLAQKLIKQVKE